MCKKNRVGSQGITGTVLMIHGYSPSDRREMYKSGSLRAPLFVGLNDKMNMKNGQSEEPRKADHGDGSEENHGVFDPITS